MEPKTALRADSQKRNCFLLRNVIDKHCPQLPLRAADPAQPIALFWKISYASVA